MQTSAPVIAAVSSSGQSALAQHVMGGTPATFADGLLAGLGHPAIAPDHLAAAIAIGILAAGQRRGTTLVIGYVLATVIGGVAHIGEATATGAEVLVALSVIALGLVLMRSRPPRIDIAIALFAFAGLVHGYALGEPVAGAAAAPLYGYFIGLALIQSALALAVMAGARRLLKHAAFRPGMIRLLGAGIIGLGLILLAQQIAWGT